VSPPRDATATPSHGSGTDPGTSGRTDLAALLALLAFPWSVQVYDAGAPTLVFPWGLVGLDPIGVTTLLDFLFRYTAGLPEFVLAWPLGTVLYAAALASAAVGVATGHEDRRVTAGLLVVAGVTGLSLAGGFSVQPGRVAIPTGTALCAAVAWWRYRSAFAWAG